MRKFVKGAISVLLVCAAAAFIFALCNSRVVPPKFCVPVILLIALFIILDIFFINRKSKAKSITAVILGIAFVCLFAYGQNVITEATNTINNIANTTTEFSNVGVYVLAEDPAENISDVADETFGILKELDRENTDKAIDEFQAALGTEITVTEVEGVTELIDSLLSQKIRVIIVNSAYLDLLDDIEGYETAANEIKEIATSLVYTEEETITVNPAEEIKDTDTDDDGVFTVYISGSDSRTGLSTKSRSDVNIIATVNTNTHQVLLVSTPRDYYVPLSISNGVKDKLTHAGIYGINVSIDTLEMLYDIEIDYYIKVCFEGVEDIVDALGGVDVYSDYTFTATNGKYEFVKGYNTVNGAQALSFVRERYAFSSGDRQRGKNQMALIEAIIDKALSPEILVTYNDLLSAVEKTVETNIPADMISSLVSSQLSSGAAWDIVSYSVDGTGDSQIPYSMSTYAYVMIPDETTVAHAKELINAVLGGEVVVEE